MSHAQHSFPETSKIAEPSSEAYRTNIPLSHPPTSYNLRGRHRPGQSALEIPTPVFQRQKADGRQSRLSVSVTISPLEADCFPSVLPASTEL